MHACIHAYILTYSISIYVIGTVPSITAYYFVLLEWKY